ncbi:Hypothetical protein SCF082_LOCUS49043 [Durusdinium trenchii]|uniref:EGF-like domain-containing protein n=1 Tax=Durusdinium trenchii TaxID=1381693 RepID=A0ABP0RYJ3_9DINO
MRAFKAAVAVLGAVLAATSAAADRCSDKEAQNTNFINQVIGSGPRTYGTASRTVVRFNDPNTISYGNTYRPHLCLRIPPGGPWDFPGSGKDAVVPLVHCTPEDEDDPAFQFQWITSNGGSLQSVTHPTFCLQFGITRNTNNYVVHNFPEGPSGRAVQFLRKCGPGNQQATGNLRQNYESTGIMSFIPHLCMCGFEDYNGRCEDVNECANPSLFSCPINSQCQNTVGTYQCRCNDGLRSRDADSVIVTSNGVCVPSLTSTAEVGSTWMRMEVEGSGLAAEVARFRVEMYQRESPTRRFEVYGAHGIVHERSEATQSGGVLFTGLVPGRRYDLTLVPLQANGAEFGGGDVAFASMVTHCSCPGGSENEFSGRPRGLVVSQGEGFVQFNFQDSSYCETAYSFSRQVGAIDPLDVDAQLDDTRKESFSPDYYFFSRTPCAQNPVAPGRAAADDLRVSALPVGENFTYCVRAVGTDYMHHPDDPDAPNLASSVEHCVTHQIHFEASISGKVTLEPAAGGLPVQGVDVTWELLDVSGTSVLASGTRTTEAGGDFQAVFNEPLQLDNDVEYPVRFTFAKTTGVIDHTFLCDEGATDCTASGTTVYVKHLQFDQPLRVIDDTSVPFRGKVVVGRTDGPDSGDGCPIIGARVCVEDVTPRVGETQSVCVDTDPDGTYRATAVIGTRIKILVDYREHDFAPLTQFGGKEIPEEGIVIEADKTYEDFDFQDTTQAHVTVDVAGGLCNHALGTAKIHFKVEGGCGWVHEVEQPDFRGYHLVPAHFLQVSVFNVVNSGNGNVINSVTQALASELRYIDLREVNEEEEVKGNIANSTTKVAAPQLDSDEAAIVAEEEAKEEDREEEFQRVRFQYDGQLVLEPRLTADRNLGDEYCSGIAGAPLSSVPGATSSFHVLPFQTVFLLTVNLKYELLQGLSCDIAADDLVVRVSNNVGLIEGAASDDAFLLELQENGYDRDLLSLLQECNGAGCERGIIHDVNPATGAKSRARLEQFLMTGRPNINGDHDKRITVSTQGVSHEIQVVVVGDYDQGGGSSFALPTYEPLLVVRDPPGGESHATFENVETTVRLENEYFEEYVGFDAELELRSVVGVTDVEACAGGGFGAIFLACARVAHSEVGAGITGGGGGDFLTRIKDAIHSGGFTTTWSYTTGTSVWLAGRLSDSFLVPQLNVQFREVDTISWNGAGTCSATKTTTNKFNLQAPENKPALAWLSVYGVERIELPKLQRLLDDSNAELLAGPTQAREDELTRQIQVTEAAIAGWNVALAEYEETNRKARDGELQEVRTLDWFKTVDKDEKEPIPDEHWDAIAVSKPLAKRSKKLDLPWTPQDESQDGAEDNLEELSKINRIMFDGGGGLFEFKMHHHKVEEHVSKMGSPLGNADAAQKIHSVGDITVKSFAGFVLNAAGGVQRHTHAEHRRTDTHEGSTSISFALGDRDIGDEFVVDVFLDPKYGTFVFDLNSGQTKCPHEGGTRTVKREDPIIEILERPRGPVLPDESMDFRVRLTNNGASPSSFQLAMDIRDNEEQAGFFAHGASLYEPHMYDRIDPGESIETLVSVFRGPTAFEYKEAAIEFRSACEFLRNVGDGQLILNPALATVKLSNVGVGEDQKIEFARPCPKVRLAGLLSREKTFTYNIEAADVSSSLPVVVFNPAYGTQTFAELVANARLQNVRLFYREVGDLAWSRAKMTAPDSSLVDVDFATPGVETPYGYVTLSWAIADSNIQDGLYELKVVSECDPVPGADEEFNAFSTPVVVGAIDRKKPKMYGLVSPAYTSLFPGDEIKISFTERILCARPFRFNLRVTVEGIDRIFDEENLNVICEGRDIAFQFDSTNIRVDSLLGRSVQVSLDAVEDVHGNVLNEPIAHKLEMVSLDLEETATSFSLRVDVACTSPVSPALEAEIVADLATLLSISNSSRISVNSMQCASTLDHVLADVNIAPVGAGNRRLLQADNDSLDAIALYYLIVDLFEDPTNLSGLPRLSVASLIPDGMVVVPGEVDAQTEASSTLLLPNPEADQAVQRVSEQMDSILEELRASRTEQEELKSQVSGLVGGIIVLSLVCVAGVVGAIVIFVRRRRARSARPDFRPKSVKSLNPKFSKAFSRNSLKRAAEFDPEEAIRAEAIDEDDL